jgi:hypothetical protein
MIGDQYADVRSAGRREHMDAIELRRAVRDTVEGLVSKAIAKWWEVSDSN